MQNKIAKRAIPGVILIAVAVCQTGVSHSTVRPDYTNLRDTSVGNNISHNETELILAQYYLTNPTTSDDYYQRAMYELEERYPEDRMPNFQRVFDDLTQAINLDLNNADAYFQRTQLPTDFLNPKNDNYYEELAIADLKRYLQLQPTGERAYDAHIGLAIGSNPDEVLAEYAKAIAIDPTRIEAYRGRARFHEQRNNLDAALADYTKLIELSPQGIEYYMNRGDVYDRMGNVAAATADYNTVIGKGVDSEKRWAYYYRGLYYFEEQNWQAAISDFTNALEQMKKAHPNGDLLHYTYLYRGTSQRMLNNHQGAINDYNEAIKVMPHEGEVYYQRGQAYGLMGNWEQSKADFQQAVNIWAAMGEQDNIDRLFRELEEARAGYATNTELPANESTKVAEAPTSGVRHASLPKPENSPAEPDSKKNTLATQTANLNVQENQNSTVALATAIQQFKNSPTDEARRAKPAESYGNRLFQPKTTQLLAANPGQVVKSVQIPATDIALASPCQSDGGSQTTSEYCPAPPLPGTPILPPPAPKPPGGEEVGAYYNVQVYACSGTCWTAWYYRLSGPIQGIGYQYQSIFLGYDRWGRPGYNTWHQHTVVYGNGSLQPVSGSSTQGAYATTPPPISASIVKIDKVCVVQGQWVAC